MKNPAEKIPAGNVKKATYAALECASQIGIDSVAFPGMGTGVGGVEKKEATEVMVRTIKEFELTNEFMKWRQKLNPDAG